MSWNTLICIVVAQLSGLQLNYCIAIIVAQLAEMQEFSFEHSQPPVNISVANANEDKECFLIPGNIDALTRRQNEDEFGCVAGPKKPMQAEETG